MMNSATKTYADFVLPPSVISRVDVSHLVAEAERIDNLMITTDVRTKAGVSATAQVTVSEQLADFLQINQLTLDASHDRNHVITQMRLLKDKAPIIHMTFASEVDAESLKQLSLWLRTTIHPQALIAVGLQPALIGGVYLRTTNHILDLSMRSMLKGSHDLLVKELGALRG